jgi:tripartite-type tricarboxylate transporter receptor subunit TctC
VVIVPMLQTVTYDPDRFAPISIVEHAPLLLAIKSSLPAKTLPDFISYAKANPGKLNYSSGGIGAVTHLLAALFATRAGFDIVHVPYKGTGPATLALLSGEVEMFFSTPSEIIPYLSDGRIRILATSSPERLSTFPDIPTIGEMFPGFSLDSWEGILATPGTPRNIVDKIAEALISASKGPWMVDRLTKLGVFPGGTTPDEFAKVIADDKVFYKAAIKVAGMGPK